MANDTIHSDLQKITVTLPGSLLARLDESVSPRGRSRFIAAAIEERLALAEQLAALDETAGAWSDANHPDMATDEDIDRWLEDLRRSWERPGAPANG
jgi:Arc/MetJ-type ribon-helix-helix transcriptional regulator